ncbi:hypothetical protein NMU03_17060 [Allocoprobacillus halotolerans]|uniref:Type II-A CRISPR-associated protein Csn2 n=1 Tax=Allocoprobacillus halotolerans TaxID=2944914 RepID=A0ABY5I1J4_9FIRM|nr:hypothetical protein [Allocoprobacillus halotolerans]UTY39229.1 hypothetical protein NMU03_17060 [Allocoprobacillus halotolerans]
MIFEYFHNTKITEYSLNHIGQINISIDNKEINKKQTLFYYVNHQYSLHDDLKLSTKSLISKYLESFLSQRDYNDTILSINILLESFAIELDSDIIKSQFVTLTPKSLLKLLIPLYFIEDEQANEYDLSYDEIIIVQLKMIEFISRDIEMTVFCLIEIPELTQAIKECIQQLNQCIVIVILTSSQVLLEFKDIYYMSNIIIDCSDDELIYETFLSKGVCTLKEAKQIMQDIVNKEYQKQQLSITKNI